MRYSDAIIEGMRDEYIGRRVRLIGTSDPYTTLVAGDEGTVSYVDDTGTVFVDWDNGSMLGLIREAGDTFAFIDQQN